MHRNRNLFVRVVVLGALCAGLFRVAVADDDYTYQSLTNLGPCASSRVLLMNNDTNPVCPIQGQGYHDTDSNTVAIGQTYWWHDDTPFDETLTSGTPIANYLNLQTGVRHILYQKQGEGVAPKKLWELVDCRAGSGARVAASGNFNYLPWSSTCQPIDAAYSAPIPNEYATGSANSNGVKQVAVITMRASMGATIYSPLYEEGIGEIILDAVNFSRIYNGSHIAIEIATGVDAQSELGEYAASFESETDMAKLKWQRVPCDVFTVEKGGGCERDSISDGRTEILMGSAAGEDNLFYRLRVSLNYCGPIRFRVMRTDLTSTQYLDYQDIILIDNIIVSYPPPSADLSPTGVDADGEGLANLGRVAAFTEPLLSVGLTNALPRMTYSANTNGLPPFIDWKASVTNADFVWRWHYLNQAYGPWATNKMSVTESGKELVGDVPIAVTNIPGDLEYYYIADVAGTHYKFFDFANDAQVDLLEADAASARVRYPDTDSDSSVSNYWSRIREGVSPWQEMHLVAEVITNAAEVLVATNDWTMELVSDHTWRGFVWTPTNYTDKVAHIKFVGKNLWETNAFAPSVASRTWYFPPGDITEIPMGSVAVTNLGESVEQDIVLDCTAGYLIFEFNEESGAFTMNRAEYQDFNKWTPEAGQEENKYIGNYVNTSYVGVAKQEYSLDMGSLTMSRSSSSYWWENFDLMAGNKDFPFDVPFEKHVTPNGWTAKKGMFINGMFAAATNKTTYGMALQLEGRGNGAISLVDSADVPQGIGTVAFSARLAQYYEMGDFCYYVDGAADKNYAISAKATMTQRRRDFSDVSTGSPSLSLVTYYRPGKGCYEFRITRVYATYNNLWDANGVMEMAIYKWYKAIDSETGNETWTSKKLKTLRLGGSSTTYNPQLSIGRYYTNGAGKTYQYQNYFVPPNTSTVSDTPNNADWTSIYFGAYTYTDTADGNKTKTYLEGGVNGVTTTSVDARTDLSNATGSMMSLSATDADEPFVKGSYGVCTRECPGAFGNLRRHALGAVGPYKGKNTGVFGNGTMENDHITDGDWESMSAGRIVSWDKRKEMDGTDYTGTYTYGLCAAPLNQRLYLELSPIGDGENWTDTGLDLRLSSYLSTNVVFAPRTTTPANIQIRVGGKSNDPRTDVAVDDVELSQWAGESSASSDLGSTVRWAYTDAWIAGSTNAVYQSGGASSSDDPVAYISRCGYYCYKVEGTENEYIYVFTNTVNGALGSYATFTPKYDITVKELFVLGGGGGGGPGGGGGGGGESLWITNAVDYAAGEGGLQIYVGRGGGGGTTRVYANASVSGGGNGENSYVWMKNPFNPSAALEQYRGYGGYRGGWVSNTSGNAAGNGSSTGGGAGGGSACKNTTRAYGREIYGAGYGGAADGGAPGGGGGGGLRGIGDNGINYAAGNAANPRSVIYAGSNGTNGVCELNGGRGGDGFPISVMGDSPVRQAIGDLLGDQDAWLGGGGGGGSGFFNAASSSTNSWWGIGAPTPGNGGNGGGGGGGLYSAGSYSNYQPGMGKVGRAFTGGGGGGGSFNNPVTGSGNNARNWILGGGAGGSGLVVMRVQVKDRFVMLQPMRGEESEPMSVRTPFLNGISLFSFSWKWADSNAVLHVQVATNGMNSANPPIRSRTTSLSDGWSDWCTINFRDMDEARRNVGATNILIGLRAPISGIVRILSDPGVVADARKGSTNNLYSMYGTVCITGIKVLDEPALDDRSWWGWNIMPTYELKWSSLYDPVTLGPGRSCGLNFSGNKADTGENDPLFADDPETADYMKHDPFVQTPRFTNRIGAVSFKARVLETNLAQSGWVTISACADPGEEDDAKWDVLTNIEITASTTIFAPYLWRIPTSQSNYQALRLTAWGAAEGRNHSEETSPAQPFGDHGTANPVPIQRVLIDEVTVTQPMSPKVAFVNTYPFRMKMSDDEGNAIPPENISSPDAQPLLGETFGVQTQLVPAGMEDELDVSSIKVYMAWYAGESPWGYENWKDLSGVVSGVELARAKDWSEGNLVYRSAKENIVAFIPPQLAGDHGYQIVQYHLWAEYKNKNGIVQEPHELSASDWKMPAWYRGIEDPNKLSAGTFSAYTVLDSISPKRAWINEINMFDGDLYDMVHQYLEIAVPQGFDMTGWTLLHFKDNDTYKTYSLASFGTDIVSFKSRDATNSYAFIAVQSPKTKAAGSYPDVDDGTWKSTAFDSGSADSASPYALRLQRPTGIIEHDVVFMCTNTATGRSRYTYEGTNFLKKLQTRLPDCDWVYAGADAYSGSLGVYTNHGETTSCWTNTMVQTPGKVNRFADGTAQFIDPDYFDPPGGTNLWIYANIDGGSLNSLEMVIGNVTNTSAVIIVPQNPDTGTFSTSIVYVVRKWFEMDSVITNEYGKSGGSVADAPGQRGVWTLDLSNLKISDPNSRKFEVTAYTRNSANIPDVAHGGISPDDPYYPAVIDWLQNYPERTIHLAPFWTMNDVQTKRKDGSDCILNLKEMYWFNIPPVTDSDTDEWVLKGGMGSGAYPDIATNIVAGGLATNIRVAVTMMITNRVTSEAYPPNMLRGLEPGSTSTNYDEKVTSWDSVTFKITGALQIPGYSDIYRPLRWFTFGPDSFTNGFTRLIEVRDPFSTRSPGFSYEWYKHPGNPVFYRWRVDDDETNRPPETVYQLNDENAMLSPTE